mmetsp:Transcript_101547/g.206193  ORF Transcript_101547/g.206193 Transcript_101547/m.206193 type:complete len:917 (+) Transcript_101547:51-2801(+)
MAPKQKKTEAKKEVKAPAAEAKAEEPAEVKKEEPAAEAKKEEEAEVKKEEKIEAKKEEATEAKEETTEAKEEATEAKKEEADTEMKEAEATEEAPKEPEKPKELEEDSPADSRTKVKADTVGVSATDATLNVMPTVGGKLLMTLTEGGFQYLLAGARSTVGVKSGRYMFEVKIVENINPSETQSQTRTPQPRQLVRVGFSLAGSSLFLSDGPDNVGFDSEGYYMYEKNRKKVAQKFRHETVAVLLNLDADSPNKNTLSLFRNGIRISEPQALPEKLCGKVLYPTITYKNVTLQVNFGPVSMVPLPFACRMLGDAAAADVEVAAQPGPKAPEVVFPVGLPESGFFDWVDTFLKANPSYTELSDRKIIEWASKSGLWKPKSQDAGSSNDKPSMKFGIPMMDDMSVRNVLMSIAPTLGKNYIVPELKANLVASERKEALLKFSAQGFKKTATVMMGEPSQEYKDQVGALILADKQAKAEIAKKKKAQEAERNRLLEEKKRKAEEARKAKEAARKKKEGKEDEVVEEEKKEPEDEKMEEEADETPVELTDEEKKLWYRKLEQPDITEKALLASFANFSMPTKEEGFDTISCVWEAEAASDQFLKDWVLQKKLTSRAEDIKPGDAFKESWTKWQKTFQEWRKKQNEWKDPAKKKALIAKKKEEAKKKAEEAKAEGGEEKEEPAEPMEINAEDIEVSTVEDICDLGNGEPLFACFAYEDWMLLSSRYELHLLLHSFKKDLGDADRPSFSPEHLSFYYTKYFRKAFNLKYFNCEKFADLEEHIKDSVTVGNKNSFLEVMQAEDTPLENFVKLTEEHRRERQRRIDAGDETAQIKFQRPAPVQAKQGGAPPSRNGGPPAAGVKRPYQQSAPAAYGGDKQARTTYGGGGAAPRPAAYSTPRTGGYGGGAGGSYGSAYGGSAYGRR